MEIKNLVENDNYCIVLDTNILLNIYRYSPEFSEFALNCLRAVKEHIIIPATVRLEYGKHCRAEFAKMQDRAKNARKETEMQINTAKTKVLATCDRLERLQFPEVEELRNSLSSKLDDVQNALITFFEERSSLELIAHAWNNTDFVMALVSDWENSNCILPAPSQEDIYLWCEEGKERYKKEVPPGFKDAKDKDGVRKYSDLIIWKEVLRYAQKEKKNVILITDDVKVDWWQTSDSGRQIHQKLIDEFTKTGQLLAAAVSHDFYNDISRLYGIEQTDAVEIALRMTDDDYFASVENAVLDKVLDDLVYSGTMYIDDCNAHVGSEGIEEFEIIDREFVSAERVDRDEDVVTYHFKYQITMEGTSYEYWGRDDDTREPILSEGTDHVFEGTITVEVTRLADIFLDFEGDNAFDSAEIIDGDFQETHFSERMEWYEPEYGELGNCPDCGCPLNTDNDMSGYCTQCAPNHD